MDKEIIEFHLKSRVIDLIDDLMYAFNDLGKKPNTGNAERVKALAYAISVLYPLLPEDEVKKNAKDTIERLSKRSTRKNK